MNRKMLERKNIQGVNIFVEYDYGVNHVVLRIGEPFANVFTPKTLRKFCNQVTLYSQEVGRRYHNTDMRQANER